MHGGRTVTLASGVDHQIGPLQGGFRLPEQARRQHVAIAEWGTAIHEKDVQVTVEPKVLKTVIQDEHIGIKLFLSQQPRGITISAYDRHKPRHRRGEMYRLVTGFGGREKYGLPIAHDAGIPLKRPAIPPGYDRNPLPAGHEESSQKCRHGRLASPPHGNVSNGDDRAVQAPDAQ
jgi:hypothetical protein